MYSISELQEEVVAARSRHIASDGAEWVRLVLALKTLFEAYSSQGMFEEAAACEKESNSILGNVQNRNSSPLPISKKDDSVLTFFDETNRWAKKAEESRTELENGGSPTKYAKTVNALCEYLCLSGQTKIALLKYEEALRVLLSKSPVNGVEREHTYLIIVILLKASECALDLGNESLSRSYSVYPLLYLAENADKDNWDSSSINWSYVADLCKTLINKQLRYENR
jgi:hypothetical protein